MHIVQNGIFKIDKKAVRSVVIGTLLGCVIITLLILISSILFLQTGKYPDSLISYITLSFLAIGGFVGGYVTGRLNKRSGLIYGIITGGALFVIVLVSGITVNFSVFTIYTLYKFVILIFSSTIGCVLGVNKKEKLHYK